MLKGFTPKNHKYPALSLTFARNLHPIRYSFMNRLILFCSVTLLLLSCKNGCNNNSAETKPEKTKDLLQMDQTNPAELRTLDSIPIPQVKDTTGKDEEYKDSLVFAQVFQLAGNRLASAEMKRNYQSLGDFAPEGILKFYGGKDRYISRLKQADSGVAAYKKVLVGPVKMVKAAKDDNGYASAWYCLIPVRSYATRNGQEVVDMSWLGGEAGINNKKVHFMNVSGVPREKILQVMPNLSVVLDEAAAEGMLP